MRIRSTVNVTILFAALTAGVGAATGLIALGIKGSVWDSITALMWVTGFIGAMVSLEFAVYGLLFLGLTEGVYKAIAPSFFTLAAKDIMLAFMLVRLLYTSLRSKDFGWLNQRLTVPVILFIGYAFAMIAAPSTHSLRLAMAGVRSWVLWIPLYYPVYVAFNNKARVVRLLQTMCLVSMPVAAYGIYQSIMGYEHLRASVELFRHTLWYTGRAISIFNAPSYLGNFCALVILVSLGLTLYYRGMVRRGLFFGTAVLAAGGLIASGTRGSLLGISVGLVVFLLLARRKILIVAIVALVGLISINYMMAAAEAGGERIGKPITPQIVFRRISHPFRQALKQVSEYPLGYGVATGVGSGRIYGGLRYSAGAREIKWIENEFGRVLTEMGLPGLFFWLWMLWVATRGAIAAARSARDNADHYLFVSMTAGMFVLLSQLLIGGALYDAAAGIYFWIFAAITVRLSKTLKEEQEAEKRLAVEVVEEEPLAASH